MSQRKVEMVDDTTPDVDADGVENEFRQLHVCPMQRLDTSVEVSKQLLLVPQYVRHVQCHRGREGEPELFARLYRGDDGEVR